ncbi:hypothetical protein U728_743 [Clostridium botulinum 202F]|nr:hypothetical protein U728_743 [Clostridium botulinum 202F]KON14729.1 hypothetical protein ACP50_00840 [Clostridium botulinum]MBY6988443.1 hypothetical protein [Clostridium botulinum]NFH01703.1 hypothetical protein [Clostridium botulinum]NFP41019.1 hypothetical protein [Clostridium botulinum]
MKRFINKKQHSKKCHIDSNKNVMVCYCTGIRKEYTPWEFIKEYFKLNTDKEVAKKCNELFGSNIDINIFPD